METTHTPTTENDMSLSIIDFVPASDHFKPTGEIVHFPGQIGRVLVTASAEAVAWDGADASITHALYSERNDVFSYCEVSVQSRTRVTWKNGCWGKVARIRFFNDDGFGEWSSVFVSEVKQKRSSER